MKLTQREKIEQFDRVAEERDNLALALYDLVNKKFGASVRRDLKDFGDGTVHGVYTIAMSFRAMPLFWIQHRDGSRKRVEIVTENGLNDIYRDNPTMPWAQAMMSAKAELMKKATAGQAK
jgi:hypothetical protein